MSCCQPYVLASVGGTDTASEASIVNIGQVTATVALDLTSSAGWNVMVTGPTQVITIEGGQALARAELLVDGQSLNTIYFHADPAAGPAGPYGSATPSSLTVLTRGVHVFELSANVFGGGFTASLAATLNVLAVPTVAGV